MLYKVTQKYGRGPATPPIAEFNKETHARIFIQAMIQKDIPMKVDITYCLLEGNEIMEEINQNNNPLTTEKASDSGQQQASTAGFQPTPFNTAPRPGGMPHGWVREEGKKEDGKN